MEVLRSTFTTDGQRLLLEHGDGGFLVATRWQKLAKTDSLYEAVRIYEVLEFCEGDLREQVRLIKAEMRRVPSASIIGNAMAYTNHILNCVERRSAGLKPRYTGSKGSVIVWQ